MLADALLNVHKSIHTFPSREAAEATCESLNLYAEDDVTYNVTENPDGTAVIASFDATGNYMETW